jgi:catechol 2,3-dioxygenase
MTEITQIGPMKVSHVNLRVADLDRAIAFYCDTLGLTVARHRPGSPLAFLSCGSGLAFDLALDVSTSRGGTPPSPEQTGLDHVAFLCPDRAAFVRAVKRIVAAGVRIEDARDHGFTESVYFRDPDGNGLEIYWEYPRERWPVENGQLGSRNTPLNVQDLLRE